MFRPEILLPQDRFRASCDHRLVVAGRRRSDTAPVIIGLMHDLAKRTKRKNRGSIVGRGLQLRDKLRLLTPHPRIDRGIIPEIFFLLGIESAARNKQTADLRTLNGPNRYTAGCDLGECAMGIKNNLSAFREQLAVPVRSKRSRQARREKSHTLWSNPFGQRSDRAISLTIPERNYSIWQTSIRISYLPRKSRTLWLA